LVLKLVKVTVSGVQPEVGLTVKESSAEGLIVIMAVCIAESIVTPQMVVS